MQGESTIRRVAGAARRLFSARETNSEVSSPEEPSFDEVVVFYNRVFDLGSFVNPTEVARKLLDEDFALAAPNYLTNDIEIATRFKELLRLRSHTQDLSEVQRHLKASGVLSVAKWVLRHPIRSWRLWQRLRSYRSSLPEEQLNGEGHADGGQGEAGTEDVEETLQGTLDFIDESMVQVGLTESLQRHVDRKLFKPQYLTEVPFTRISLQPFDTTLAGEKIGVDVGLLVHRTGVAILTFYVMFGGQKSAKQLLDLELMASKPEIAELRIARAILEPHWRSYGGRSSELDEGLFEREYSSGIEWLTYRWGDKGTLVDIFDMYETAIVSSLKGKHFSYPDEPWSWRRTPAWFIYPIVFARRIIPKVQDNTTFKQLYPRVIAGLIQRVGWWGLTEANIAGVVEEDLSIHEDHSVYVEGGHAAVFYLEPYRRKLMKVHGDDIPGQDWLHSHFQTSTIVDVLLIERWILTILNAQLSDLTSDLASLNTLKRNLLMALEEYHNIAITYGSAQDIIRRARGKMGTDELYQGVMQKLSILDRLIEVDESRRRAWRDRLLAAGTAIVTAMLGLPAASEITQVVAGWDTVAASAFGGWGAAVFNTVVRFTQSHPAMVTIALYGFSLCFILVLIFLSIWPSRGRRRIIRGDQSQPAFTKGFTWHEGFVWHDRSSNFGQQDANDPNPNKPTG